MSIKLKVIIIIKSSNNKKNWELFYCRPIQYGQIGIFKNDSSIKIKLYND